MGRLHMESCLHIDDVKVVAVADKSERALKKAEAFGIKSLYTDYEDLIRNHHELDAVIISLPNFLHFESIKSAIEAGLDVFVEKPMASSVNECKDIVKMVENNGVKFMVGHNLRFYKPIEIMKENVDKGYLGNLEAATLEEITNGPFEHPAIPKLVPEWWFEPEKVKGGALLDIGSHMIDLFQFFAGDHKLLFSRLNHKFNLPVEDGATLILASERSSTVGIVNVGWFQKAVFPNLNFRMILHGTVGYLSSEDLAANNVYVYAAKQGFKNFIRRIIGNKIRPLSYSEIFESYYKELSHFLNYVKDDLTQFKGATHIDGLKAVETIEEAYIQCPRFENTQEGVVAVWAK